MSGLGFSAVDTEEDPSAFADYLDLADADPTIQAYKGHSFEALGDLQGARVLDVGCGLGADVRALAARVGPRGRVVGLDRSATLLRVARARSGTTARGHFVRGEASALPFPPGHFDAVRFDRVLIHVAEADQALQEAARVLRSGGRLVALEADFDTLTVAHPDPLTTRRIVGAWTRRYPQTTIGRALPARIRAAGFQRVRTRAYALTLTDPQFAMAFLAVRALVRNAVVCDAIGPMQAIAWWVGLQRLCAEGEFVAVLTGIGVSASAPSAKA